MKYLSLLLPVVLLSVFFVACGPSTSDGSSMSTVEQSVIYCDQTPTPDGCYDTIEVILPTNDSYGTSAAAIKANIGEPVTKRSFWSGTPVQNEEWWYCSRLCESDDTRYCKVKSCSIPNFKVYFIQTLLSSAGPDGTYAGDPYPTSSGSRLSISVQ